MTELDPHFRAFLQERRFAVLATLNKDGSPQQTVVWYELQGGRIMMNTRKGTLKERNLRRDPRASLCIEDGYRYLTIAGEAELDYDNDRSQASIKALATRYEGAESAERQSREQFSNQQRVTIYMSIDNIVFDR